MNSDKVREENHIPCACRFDVFSGDAVKVCPRHQSMLDENERLKSRGIEDMRNRIEALEEVVAAANSLRRALGQDSGFIQQATKNYDTALAKLENSDD